MAHGLEGEEGLSRAMCVEAELEQKTRYLLESRARMNQDHGFLQHYAQAAQLSAVEQYREAEATDQALNNFVSANYQAQQELRQVQQDCAREVANLRANQEAQARVSASIVQMRRSAAGEINRIQSLVASEEHVNRTVGQKSEMLRRVLQTTKLELETASGEAQKQRRRADEAEAALEGVHRETREREALVQRVLQETLKRLEADFTRERVDHDAHDSRIMKRLEQNPKLAKQAGVCTTAASSAVLESKAAGPRLRASPSAPAYERSSAAQEAHNDAVDKVAAANTALGAANTGFLTDVRNDLGLSQTFEQVVAPVEFRNLQVISPLESAIGITPLCGGSRDIREEVVATPSALEVQVNDLRKQQEALEAIWKDKSWKHQGVLVQNHIAALAARSSVAVDTADAEVAAARASMAEGTAPRPGSLPRPLVSNGLLYV